MNPKLPRKSKTPIKFSARERKAIKAATSRAARRDARRDPETLRPRTRGWAD